MLIDTKVTKFPITKAWEKGQLAVKEGRMDDARDMFDMGYCYGSSSFNRIR